MSAYCSTEIGGWERYLPGWSTLDEGGDGGGRCGGHWREGWMRVGLGFNRSLGNHGVYDINEEKDKKAWVVSYGGNVICRYSLW